MGKEFYFEVWCLTLKGFCRKRDAPRWGESFQFTLGFTAGFEIFWLFALKSHFGK